MAHLILVRHGMSAWNKLGLWTGLKDIGLVEEGVEEARRAGETLQDLEIHAAHTSILSRAKETFEEIKKVLGKKDLVAKEHPALNERNYGTYTGKNKWQVKEEIGDEAFHRLRRGWNVPIPEGETLKEVHDRVVPYYKEHVLPELTKGHSVLMVAHGNSLRALIKHLENISDEDIPQLEMATGVPHIYTIGSDGRVVHKEVRDIHEPGTEKK